MFVVLHRHGCTDIGHNRSLNEDFYKMNNFLFVLADGMGGHNAGEIASKLAVNQTMTFIKGSNISKYQNSSDTTLVQQMIRDTIRKTNELIFKKSLQTPAYQGMGTTLVIAAFQKPNTMHIANVGDSRAYLFRNNILELLTEDHSVAADMIREGSISPRDAKAHPYRHYLTRSIGTGSTVEVFSRFFSVFPNDIILLCSDGLWDILPEEEMIRILQTYASPRNICRQLISRAHELQSNDNMTCIVITVSKGWK